MKRLIITTAAVLAMTVTSSASYVTAESGLRVREAPSTEANVIEVLPFGTEVTGTVRSGWMKLENGYVSTEFLSDEDPLSEWTCYGDWTLTAYYETGMPTASGVYPVANVTMAHNTLPFGTQVYVQGYGMWEVQDRGPASMGTAWADLYLQDFNTCVQFGVKTAKVYVKEMP